MKTLTLENLNDNDLELFITLATRLKLKVKIISQNENSNEITDYIDSQTGEYLSLAQFKEKIQVAEDSKTMDKNEFWQKINQKWQK